jgi:hypothetical protein
MLSLGAQPGKRRHILGPTQVHRPHGLAPLAVLEQGKGGKALALKFGRKGR